MTVFNVASFFITGDVVGVIGVIGVVVVVVDASPSKRCKLQNLKLITDKSFGLPDWDEIKIPRKFESCIRCFYVDEVRLRYVL